LFPCTVEIKKNFFFLIKAKCVACGNEHSLLDADFYGWNGFVCQNPNKLLFRDPLCLGNV
jgi:hypothetical protein